MPIADDTRATSAAGNGYGRRNTIARHVATTRTPPSGSASRGAISDPLGTAAINRISEEVTARTANSTSERRGTPSAYWPAPPPKGGIRSPPSAVDAGRMGPDSGREPPHASTRKDLHGYRPVPHRPNGVQTTPAVPLRLARRARRHRHRRGHPERP